MMAESLQEQLALVTSFYEDVWNRADDVVLDRILARDVRFKGSTESTCRYGLDAFREYRDTIRSILADYICTILDVTFADANSSFSLSDDLGMFALGTLPHCVARVKFSGEHVAPFHVPPLDGFPATGKQLSWLGVAYIFFTEGEESRIQGIWVMGDVATIYQQLQQNTDLPAFVTG